MALGKLETLRDGQRQRNSLAQDATAAMFEPAALVRFPRPVLPPAGKDTDVMLLRSSNAPGFLGQNNEDSLSYDTRRKYTDQV